MVKPTEFVITAGTGIQLQVSYEKDHSVHLTIKHLSNTANPNWMHSEIKRGGLTIMSFRDSHQQDNEDWETTRELRQRIETGWIKRIAFLDLYAKGWSENPCLFFGSRAYGSSEQWSFRSLCDTDEKRDKDRNIFHRINLANCFQQRVNSDNLPEIECKRAMLASADPQFPAMTQEQNASKERKLNRHLEQGETLRSMWRLSPGLVLAAGCMTTAAQLKLVSKMGFGSSELEWISSEKLGEARKYDGLAIDILASLSVDSERRVEIQKRPQLGNNQLDAFQVPVQTRTEDIRHLDSVMYSGNAFASAPLLSVPSHDSLNSAARQCINTLSTDPFEPNFVNAVACYGDNLRDADYLLLLFYALGGSNIPALLLQRGGSVQLRWTEDGCERNLIPSEACLDPQLVGILTTSSRFAWAMDELSPTISSTPSSDGSIVYSLKKPLQVGLSTSLTDLMKMEWTKKALGLICFVFPREQIWEPRYVSVGTMLRPPLFFVLSALEVTATSVSVRIEAAEALLAASSIGDIDSRKKATTMATSILGTHAPPDYFRAGIAYQESVLFRLIGDYDRSECTIRTFCRASTSSGQTEPTIQEFYRDPGATSKRMYALRGRLHVSHLENLVQTEKYTTAIDEIDDWMPMKNPSPMAASVLPKKSIVISKIFRSQGRFEQAREELVKCLLNMPTHAANRYQVICNLADSYSDLGLPNEAHEILAPEFEILKLKPRKGKPYRRLLVAMIDAYIGRSLYEIAENAVKELEPIFADLVNVDVSDQLLHMRILIASARISYYKMNHSEALKKWDTALLHLERYGSFKDKGYIYAVISLSISLSQLHLDNIDESREALDRAACILGTEIQDFWIPALASWRKYVELRIESPVGRIISPEQKPTDSPPIVFLYKGNVIVKFYSYHGITKKG